MSAANGPSPPNDAADTASESVSARPMNRQVRHELRTQLNQIIGYSDLLIDEATQRALTDLIPDLQKIHIAGLRLLKLINDHVDPVTRRADNMPQSYCDGTVDEN